MNKNYYYIVDRGLGLEILKGGVLANFDYNISVDAVFDSEIKARKYLKEKLR